MSGYIYAQKDTGYFAKISTIKLSDPKLILVDSLPPSTLHRWDGDNWVLLTETEQQKKELDSSGVDVEEVISDRGTTLRLNDLASLNVGNNRDRRSEYDVFYKTNAPEQKQDGISNDKKDFLTFPKLAWDKTVEIKTVSFIYYVSSDSRYIVFGLAGDRYNWSSNDYNNLDIGVRIRTFRGLYGCYGLSQNGNSTYTSSRYSSADKNSYYRLDIPNNAERGEFFSIYQLPNGDPANWLFGKLVAYDDVPYSPSRSGKIWIPGVWDYTGNNNRILGVIVR